MEEINEEQLKRLTLLMIYLQSWDENVKKEYHDGAILRAWQGYDFGILDSLSEEGFISDSKRAKSVYLTEEGIRKAKEIQEKISGI